MPNASRVSFDERIARLNRLTAGWINYFKLANMHGKLRDIDVWTRRRLHGCIWSRRPAGEETKP